MKNKYMSRERGHQKPRKARPVLPVESHLLAEEGRRFARILSPEKVGAPTHVASCVMAEFSVYCVEYHRGEQASNAPILPILDILDTGAQLIGDICGRAGIAFKDFPSTLIFSLFNSTICSRRSSRSVLLVDSSSSKTERTVWDFSVDSRRCRLIGAASDNRDSALDMTEALAHLRSSPDVVARKIEEFDGNAKVSDSAYSNSSNSQSQSSESSVSRHNNQSESSGYCDGLPSLFESREALQSGSKRKDKEHKKKKSKTTSAENVESELILTNTGQQSDAAVQLPSYADTNAPSNTVQHYAAVVELVDAEDPGERKGETWSGPGAGLGPRTNAQDESSFQDERFCTVVSMQDGLVLCTTSSLGRALGFARDSWTGRPFADFAQPRDKDSLRHQITREDKGSKAPEETSISSKLTRRHSATWRISYVDPDVARYLGHLPQDMVGRSLFDFYHPEDVPIIKEIHETVTKMEGSSFRSKPYRFAGRNGDYVTLETHWSSFINPWTKKIEFVVGQHRVLEGPEMNDQLSKEPNRDEPFTLREKLAERNEAIEEEIRTLLRENFSKVSEVGEQLDTSTRYNVLASFMESLLHEVESSKVVKDPTGDDRSFSGSRNPLLQEHDSVIIGEMSPHHEYQDSKSSTETLPSYNQLNFNENIERFFNSEPPFIATYGSDEENTTFVSVPSSDEGRQVQSICAGRKCISPTNGSGISGSGSTECLSSGSNNLTSSASREETLIVKINNMGPEHFKHPMLTKSLLNKHNEDMEKLMVQKHKELRSRIKYSNRLKDSLKKVTADKSFRQPHGTKRRLNHCCEIGNLKMARHEDTLGINNAGITSINTTIANNTLSLGQSNVNVTMRAPIAAMVSLTPAQPCITTNGGCFQALPRLPVFPSMIPVYYVPVSETKDSMTGSVPKNSSTCPSAQALLQNPYMLVPVQCVTNRMGDMFYPSIIGAPAPTYRPFSMSEHASATCNRSESVADNSMEMKEPTIQATRVKGERGSTAVASEFSKKVQSSGEMFSPCVSVDGGCSSLVESAMPVNIKPPRHNNYNGDGSSSSSIYSSFLYKSSGSSCNPDQKTQEKEKRHPCQGMLRKEPSWLEGVDLTPQLIYEYQMPLKAIDEVLQKDKNALKNMNQPLLVNDQLSQLYTDLELDGFGTKLMLEDGNTSSSSDSDSSVENVTLMNRRTEFGHYSTQEDRCSCTEHAMIYEKKVRMPSVQEITS
ncbi:period circadian protein isoform X1 [Orussus abietinus]|uniref:period circadian protein isoform X1 n=1 Tax=Orussus abietinus TaxID=222816 RepID=UPI000625842F|nr:period circadian protein isoform X1 [Orussus abietinus]